MQLPPRRLNSTRTDEYAVGSSRIRRGRAGALDTARTPPFRRLDHACPGHAAVGRLRGCWATHLWRPPMMSMDTSSGARSRRRPRRSQMRCATQVRRSIRSTARPGDPILNASRPRGRPGRYLGPWLTAESHARHEDRRGPLEMETPDPHLPLPPQLRLSAAGR